jgi:dihydrofolate reductase
MTISLVVAASENNVIGKDNRLLWHLPNDMKFFKNTTWGMPVIMGRKTFESLGKPLAGRTNIVMTHDPQWSAAGTKAAANMEEAMQAAADTDAKEVFVIGGGEIFRQALPKANRVYLTRVHTHIDGDTFFPELPAAEWTLLSQLDFATDAKHAHPYSFQIWQRNKEGN